ncbi:MAG: hypothetical protein J6V57_04265 [Spirochaetaceae bacterium]|nr:hypothetical protein [Spirochaetaceae bacterium]
MKKTTILVILLVFTLFSLSAQVFNNKLTSDEQQRLANGELVIRNIGKAKNISINGVNDTLSKTIDTIKDLNPSYLAEVIRMVPYAGNEDLLEKLRPIILNVEDYVGIPYYSERHETYYDLYSSVEIKSQSDNGNTARLNAIMEMSPFGGIDTDIILVTDDESLYYENTNLNNLKYHEGITVVKDKCMKSIVSVFRFGDSWILYGIGGVKAPSIFFLRDRVETSFMNRIKTMCSYFFENL